MGKESIKSLKLYKDINTQKLEYLLEATPFSTNTGKTFSGRLTEEIFFDHLFVPASRKGLSPQDQAEIVNFESGINNVIREFGNEHERVALIHIKGYGGCGKTTYLHYLLRKIRKSYKYKSDCIDYEKASNAEQPLVRKLVDICLRNDVKALYEFLHKTSKKELLVMEQFDVICNQVTLLADAIRKVYLQKPDDFTRGEIEQAVKSIKDEYSDPDDYLYFLFATIFILLIYERFQGRKIQNEPMILVVDNVDSMEPLAEEMRLVPVLSKFIDRCTMFVTENLLCDKVYNNFRIDAVLEQSKFVFILTTRVVTARRYSALIRRGDEERHEWNEFDVPENYYNHKSIVSKKVEFFDAIENTDSPLMRDLKRANEIAGIVYLNPMYQRLFNGNIRYCFAMLKYITKNVNLRNMIDVCQDMKQHREFEGANGIILNIILRYFKSKGIYQDKLHLSECSRDGTISSSRIILTLLRENGGSLSLVDLLDRLTPIFSSTDICRTIIDLSEGGREVWRRLITFGNYSESPLMRLHFYTSVH